MRLQLRYEYDHPRYSISTIQFNRLPRETFWSLKLLHILALIDSSHLMSWIFLGQFGFARYFSGAGEGGGHGRQDKLASFLAPWWLQNILAWQQGQEQSALQVQVQCVGAGAGAGEKQSCQNLESRAEAEASWSRGCGSWKCATPARSSPAPSCSAPRD